MKPKRRGLNVACSFMLERTSLAAKAAASTNGYLTRSPEMREAWELRRRTEIRSSSRPVRTAAASRRAQIVTGVTKTSWHLHGGRAPLRANWLATTADVRLHQETKRRPIDLYQEEKPHLLPLPAHLMTPPWSSTAP
jgi:uncharacterized protein YecE (DUF72 family)